MSLPMEFSFDGAAVRVVLVAGEPWWVANDVAAVLEYSEASAMTRHLDDDEKGLSIVQTPSSNQHGDFGTAGQQMLIINESGLYSAILRSRKASAKRFKKWVTAEVLPSIRRHGAYVMPGAAIERPELPQQEPRIEADQMVSAGRVFRALFGTARSMGMSRRLAATRANQAATRSTGVDLAAELGATEWLDAPDLPEPQRLQYELQQRIREHLVANEWPQNFTTQLIAEALGLEADKGNLMAIGTAVQLLGYRRVRLSTPGRPWAYAMKLGRTG